MTKTRTIGRWAASVMLIAATTLQLGASPMQTTMPVHTVPFVDLDRYAGDWFEVGRFPNKFQRQCLGDVRATYTRRSDGRVDVVNRCRTADGETEEVQGAGVVGEQPVLRPGEQFEYTSFCPLKTNVGTMHGSYTMTTPSGDVFQARIAPFTLAVPFALN